MNVWLLHPDRAFDTQRPLPSHAATLSQDLDLTTLWSAMAQGDRELGALARMVMLRAAENDLDTVHHRQGVWEDTLHQPDAVRRLHQLATDTLVKRKEFWFSSFLRQPSSVLRTALRLMCFLVERLQALHDFAVQHEHSFRSAGLTRLCAQLRAECGPDYTEAAIRELRAMLSAPATVMTAALDAHGRCEHIVLQPPPERTAFWRQWLPGAEPRCSFELHPRDEAGARFLAELEDRALEDVAQVLTASCEHVTGYFEALQRELGFYLAALQLHDALQDRGVPMCTPVVAEAAALRLAATELRDAALALTHTGTVVGNDVDADGRGLVVITGANQGGKSSFLRACGLVQLMMQAGIFVCAQTYAGSLCTGVFTHYKREEDASLSHGKLDEELARLDAMASEIRPGALFLSNESFASTHEREGSELALQTVTALRACGVRVLAVSHLYDFTRRVADANADDTLFLRAERRADGTRSYRVVPGAPLPTSHGADVYQLVFGQPLP